MPNKFITNETTVTEFFTNANSDMLPDYADRDLQYNDCGDFVLVDNENHLIGGVAIEYEVISNKLHISVGFLHIEPESRGQGFGGELLCPIYNHIQLLLDKSKDVNNISLSACLVSEGGGDLCWKLYNTVTDRFKNVDVNFWASDYGYIQSIEDIKEAVLCEKY